MCLGIQSFEEDLDRQRYQTYAGREGWRNEAEGPICKRYMISHVLLVRSEALTETFWRSNSKPAAALHTQTPSSDGASGWTEILRPSSPTRGCCFPLGSDPRRSVDNGDQQHMNNLNPTRLAPVGLVQHGTNHLWSAGHGLRTTESYPVLRDHYTPPQKNINTIIVYTELHAKIKKRDTASFQHPSPKSGKDPSFLPVVSQIT